MTAQQLWKDSLLTHQHLHGTTIAQQRDLLTRRRLQGGGFPEKVKLLAPWAIAHSLKCSYLDLSLKVSLKCSIANATRFIVTR